MAGGRRPDFDVVISERPKNQGDKRFYRKVGSAWRSDKGDMINIKIDAGIALVGVAGVDVTLFPPRDRDGGGGGGGGGRQSAPVQSDFSDAVGDDDIPF